MSLAPCGRRRRPLLVAAVCTLALCAAFALGGVSSAGTPPQPAEGLELDPRPCAYEGNDPFEKRFYQIEGWKGPDYERYPGACQRMRFSFGPIVVKPGQNDVLVEPVTIEKPMRDGYITRFRAQPRARRRQRAADRAGPPPPRHLALGRRATAAARSSPPARRRPSPRSRAATGCRSRRPTPGCCSTWSTRPSSSRWRSTSPTTSTSSRRTRPRSSGIKPAYPLWLDVRPSGYPVFNTQRDFGGKDGECTWPKEQCAAFDPWGKQIVGQGEPGNGKGEDLELPGEGRAVRRDRELHRRHADRDRRPPASGRDPERDRPGPRRQDEDADLHRAAPPTGTAQDNRRPAARRLVGLLDAGRSGFPFWGVRVKPGDMLRSNATYDTSSSRPTRTWASRSACSCPTTRTASRRRPGVNPFKAPRRPLARPAGRAACQAKRPTLCDQGRRHPRPPAPRTTTTAARSGEWERRELRRRNEVGDRRLPLRARRPLDDRRCRHPDREARRDAQLHQLRGRGDLPHGHLVQVPVPRPDGRGVPARRRHDQHRAQGRLRLLGARVRHAGDRAGEADSSTGACRDRRTRATSPARSSPTSAASTRSCAARSRSPSESTGSATGSPRRRPRRTRSRGRRWPRTCRSTSCRARTTSTSRRRRRASRWRSWRSPTRETERWRRKFNMSRRAVRAHRGGDGDRLLGDRRRPRRASSATTAGRQAVSTGRPDACDLEWAGRKGLETLRNLPGEFIFDVQSHHVDPDGMWRVTNPAIHAFFARGLAADARGRRGRPDREPLALPLPQGDLPRLGDDVHGALGRARPRPTRDNPLPIAEASQTIDIVNELARSQRSVMHAFVMPNRGGTRRLDAGRRAAALPRGGDAADDGARGEVPRHRLRGWKTYCAWGDVPNASGWFLDSRHRHGASSSRSRRSREKYPEIPPTVATHKGFALPGLRPARRRAARRRPGREGEPRTCNIIVYHSGYDTGDDAEALPRRRRGRLGHQHGRRLHQVLRENNYDAPRFRKKGKRFGNVPNVYAELGSVWRDAMHDPDQAAHLLGKLINHVGPKRVVWGTDSLWYGSPQPEIVALRRFEFTERGQGALRAAVRARGRRRGPDPQGAEARRGRSATASSAATSRRPTRSTPTSSATRSAATRSTRCARTTTCAAQRATPTESRAARLEHLRPARARGARSEGDHGGPVVAVRPAPGRCSRAGPGSRWRSPARRRRGAPERAAKAALLRPANVAGRRLAELRPRLPPTPAPSRARRRSRPATSPSSTPAWSFSTTDAGGEGDITGHPGHLRRLRLRRPPPRAGSSRSTPTPASWSGSASSRYGGGVNGSVAAQGKRVYVGVSRLQRLGECPRRGRSLHRPLRGGALDAATGRVAWATRSLDAQPGIGRLRQPGDLRRRR